MIINTRNFLPLTSLLAALLIIGGCASNPSRYDIRVPKSGSTRPGNPPFYDVNGERFFVLNDNHGYVERGVASWYGEEFNGRSTANGEIFDMNAMTAAHKTLKLPTYARVTNLRNGKQVVVRVNDRGPFVPNRLIDLSYAAARDLDMVATGTTLVEVETLPNNSSAKETENWQENSEIPARYQTSEQPQSTIGSSLIENLYVQIGAFSDANNAHRVRAGLEDEGVGPVSIYLEPGASPPLHRVRIGPITDVAEYDRVAERLHSLGIQQLYLVQQE